MSEQKNPNKRLHSQTGPNAESIVGNHSTSTSCFLRAASGCKSLQCMVQELYNWLACPTTGKHRKTSAIKNPLILHYCSSPCSLAAQTDDRSTPDRGTRYGVCEENQSDCAEISALYLLTRGLYVPNASLEKCLSMRSVWSQRTRHSCM